ncbi:hypothetical protein [Candidatus Nitrosocosmicus sp. FF01]|uniref:hypothetical protein n=1 Tax=Candidatus Nitrosocosmicus sp. FF01 TaxID=3397670 RepID=UPI0039E800B2
MDTELTSREIEILKFIERNPGKDKEFVIDYCNKEGIGSRVVISRLINDLIEKNIINDGKTKKNQKSYKLNVNSKNLLLIIPKDLDEIFEQFKLFMGKIGEIIEEEKSKDNSHIHAIKKNDDTPPKNVLSILEFSIVEIINDVYMFYFVNVLPHKLDNKEQINRLYSVYFGKVSEMYSYLASDSFAIGQPFTLDDIRESTLCKNYVLSKGLSTYERVLAVKKICKGNNLEYHLNNLLDLLWTKNIESVILLYHLQYGSIVKSQSVKKDPSLQGDAMFDAIEVLEKIHYHFDELIKIGGMSKIESLI